MPQGLQSGEEQPEAFWGKNVTPTRAHSEEKKEQEAAPPHRHPHPVLQRQLRTAPQDGFSASLIPAATLNQGGQDSPHYPTAIRSGVRQPSIQPQQTHQAESREGEVYHASELKQDERRLQLPS